MPNRLAPLICALLMASVSCSAAPAMTCEQLKTKLAVEIRAQGDKVAQPSGFKIGFKQEGNPHIRYGFGGIDGITGNLNCQKNDAFQDINFESSFEDGHLDEYALRIARLLALGSASLCSIEQMTASACMRWATKLHAKAFASFHASKLRGELSPRGAEDASVSTRTQIEWSVVSGGMLVTISNMATDIY